MKKIILTGGGTAGHVTPNIALLPYLRKAGFHIHYIGTAKGIEHELIKRENITFHSISAGKLRRYFDFKNVTDIFRILIGFIQALIIVARIKPDVVFSKGGFVSCAVVWASWFSGKPVIIHESDMTPGLANRLCIPFARKICYCFPETASMLPENRRIQTGLPIRESLFSGNKEQGMSLCGFTNNKPVIMVIGGSLGSQVINASVRKSLDVLLTDFNICHICGKDGLDADRPGYCQFEYVNDELPHLFAITDLAVSRSGATVLFEFLGLSKPSLLIPLASNASRGDQILNARSFEKQGFSVVLPQEQLDSQTLVKQIRIVYEKRDIMKETIEKSPVTDGIDKITTLIEELSQK